MDIGTLLSENLTPNTLGDIMVYLILGLALVTMFTIPEKNPVPSNLILVVVFATIIDLLRGSNGELFASFGGQLYGGGHGYMGFGDNGFGTLMLHLVMSLLPFMTMATMRYRGRSKNKIARITAILTGIIAAIYTVAAFFVPQVVNTPI